MSKHTSPKPDVAGCNGAELALRAMHAVAETTLPLQTFRRLMADPEFGAEARPALLILARWFDAVRADERRIALKAIRSSETTADAEGAIAAMANVDPPMGPATRSRRSKA